MSKLTKEEAAAAVEAAERAKEEANKGTSLEKTPALELTPEMQRAITESVEKGIEKLDETVAKRATSAGETYRQAQQVVSNAVDAARELRRREQVENRIIAKCFSGRFQRDGEMIKQALEEECEFLNRDTAVHSRFAERAMGAATAGDELVPEMFSNRVVENIEQHGLVRRYATIIPMTTDTMNVPTITTGLTAYEVSAGSQITASDLVTSSVTLATRKLATITAMHNELILNANPAIVPILVNQAGKALSNKEDTLGLTGSGSTVTGILESSTNNRSLGNSSTGGETTIASVDFDDLGLLLDELASNYINDACAWYFNKKVLYYLQTAKNSSDYYWKPASAGNPATIHGFPYRTSSVMSSAPSTATAFAFFGDLKNLYMGDRGAITVTIGTEGTVGSDNIFEKDMAAIRVTEQAEFEIADAEGFAILKTDAS